jgi:hypothetical protein
MSHHYHSPLQLTITKQPSCVMMKDFPACQHPANFCDLYPTDPSCNTSSYNNNPPSNTHQSSASQSGNNNNPAPVTSLVPHPNAATLSANSGPATNLLPPGGNGANSGPASGSNTFLAPQPSSSNSLPASPTDNNNNNPSPSDNNNNPSPPVTIVETRPGPNAASESGPIQTFPYFGSPTEVGKFGAKIGGSLGLLPAAVYVATSDCHWINNNFWCWCHLGWDNISYNRRSYRRCISGGDSRLRFVQTFALRRVWLQ